MAHVTLASASKASSHADAFSQKPSTEPLLELPMASERHTIPKQAAYSLPSQLQETSLGKRHVSCYASDWMYLVGWIAWSGSHV